MYAGLSSVLLITMVNYTVCVVLNGTDVVLNDAYIVAVTQMQSNNLSCCTVHNYMRWASRDQL